jgi:hypothetical protein
MEIFLIILSTISNPPKEVTLLELLRKQESTPIIVNGKTTKEQEDQ